MHQETLITAPTMAQALAKLKRELGPDAMILSHEEYLGSVHIKAIAGGAVDTYRVNESPVKSVVNAQQVPDLSRKSTAMPVTRDTLDKGHNAPSHTTRASAQMQDAILLPEGVSVPVWARVIKAESETNPKELSTSTTHDNATRNAPKAFPTRVSDIVVSLAEGVFTSPMDAISALCDLCDYHQLGDEFADIWLNAMNPEFSNPTISLEPALRQSLLHDENWLQSCSNEHPIVLVGPPGSGKTVTIAKLAESLLSAGKDVSVVSLDIIKSTGSRQLELYLKPLGLELDIGHAFLKNRVRDKIILVDTPGINIYDAHDQRYLEALYAQVGSPLTLVLHADINPVDAAEISTLYKSAGAKFLIATRLDLSRRLGAIVQSATQGLTLALLSKSPNLSDGLMPINIKLFLQTMMKASKVHTP